MILTVKCVQIARKLVKYLISRLLKLNNEKVMSMVIIL